MFLTNNKIKLLLYVILIVFLWMNTSTILAQMPLHPDLLKSIKEGKSSIQLSSIIKDISALKQKGIDAPWSRINQQLQKTTGTNSFKRSYGPAKSPSGNWKALVLLVQFSDQPAHASPSSFDSLLFAQKNGTLWDYYHQVSYGSLDIVTVNLPSSVGWMTAPQTYSYYVDGKKGMGEYPRNAQKLVEDVVQMADPFVDFSKYDNDGDGKVDALFIIHTGSGFELSGNVNEIHSHAWTTYTSQNVDGVIVSKYSIEPEYWRSPGDMTIGVYAHELGHAAFGLPDVYDTDYSSEGLGDWSLMASGSWGGKNGSSPSWPDAWSQIQMGFINPEIITVNQQNKTIYQKETSPQVLLLWKDGIVGKQYFLIENRQKASSDSSLSNSGLLIYHVDESVTTGNDNEKHYMVALEQADGMKDLENGKNRGDDGDPFPGSKSNTNFSYDTNPNSLDYGLNITGVSVKNISNSASTMTADIEVNTTEKILKIVTPNGGEKWYAGFKKQITILAANTGTVELEYSIDNGKSWTLIENVEPSLKIFKNTQAGTNNNSLGVLCEQSFNSAGSIITWLVPNSPSNQCRIRATSLSDPSVTDMSDSTFSIIVSQGVAILQYDDGANQKSLGTNVTTTYTFEASVRFTSDIVTPYNGWSITKLEVYIGNEPLSFKIKIHDAGTETNPGVLLYSKSFTPVANSWNTFELETPVMLSNKDVWVGYEVSICGNSPMGVDDGPRTEDGDWIYSDIYGSWIHLSTLGLDNNWNIHAICEKVNYLTLLSPNGGESWKQNTQRKIKWASAGVENIKIDYSTNNGVNWNEIIASVPGNIHEYYWNIPKIITSESKIRITNTYDTAMSDESDNVFNIVAGIGIITEIESNNTIETANKIIYADSIDATILPVGDIDYYKFNGTSGDTVIIYSENKTGSNLNGTIKLLNSSGKKIISNDDYISTNNSRIVYVIPSSDTYYIRYSYVWNNDGMPSNEIKYRYTEKETQKECLKQNSNFAPSNEDKGEYRLVLSLFKKSAPFVLNVSTYDVNYNSIQLSGVIYPNGSSATIKFEYGQTTSYGSTYILPNNVNELNEYTFSAKILGLSGNTLYHCRVVAFNEYGSQVSDDITFTTPESPVGWARLDSGVNGCIYAVDFYDVNHGVAVGWDNEIYKTSDGGISWTNIYTAKNWSDFYGQGIDFVTLNKIVIVGYPAILVSNDGGATWSSTFTNHGFVSNVSFLDEKNGLIVDNHGNIYKTTNGGLSWMAKHSTNSNYGWTWSIDYYNSNLAIAVGADGTNGHILKTTDGGETWADLYTGTDWFSGVDVIDENTYVICGSYIFIKTIDGGKTWTASLIDGQYSDIKFIDSNNGMIVGDNILATSDGGKKWTKEKIGTNNHLYGISTPIKGVTYAVGEHGTILMKKSLPSVPQLVSPSNNEINQPKDILIKWMKTEKADSYLVELSQDSTFMKILIKDSTVADTVKTIKGLENSKKYYWRVQGKNSFGYGGWSKLWNFKTSVAAGMDNEENIPTEYSISQNYPNPFNPSTIIRFGLPKESRVTLSIYNILGQRVELLIDGVNTSGYHSTIWDASKYSSGIYIYKINAIPENGDKPWTQTKKMIFMK